MNKRKANMFFCIILSSLLVCSCSIFERRYSNLYLTEKNDGFQHFRLELGCHSVEDKMKSANLCREKAIAQLLNKELSKKKLCNSGYAVIERKVSRHMDVVIYGKCIE
jgi:hypothetical protein